MVAAYFNRLIFFVSFSQNMMFRLKNNHFFKVLHCCLVMQLNTYPTKFMDVDANIHQCACVS